jgi:hypothetical protein
MKEFLDLQPFFTNSEKTENAIFREPLITEFYSDFEGAGDPKAFMVQSFQKLPEETKEKILAEEASSAKAIILAKKIFDTILPLYPDFLPHEDNMYWQNQRFGNNVNNTVKFLVGFFDAELDSQYDSLKLSCSGGEKFFGQECRKTYAQLQFGYQDLGLVMFHAIANIYTKKITDNTLSTEEMEYLPEFIKLSPDMFPTFLVVNKGTEGERLHSGDYGQEWRQLPALIASHAKESDRS